MHASVCVLTCKSQVFGPLALTLTLGLAPCSSTACQEEEAVEIEAGSETGVFFVCLIFEFLVLKASVKLYFIFIFFN